jgi:hypothetical protein
MLPQTPHRKLNNKKSYHQSMEMGSEFKKAPLVPQQLIITMKMANGISLSLEERCYISRIKQLLADGPIDMHH